MALSSRAKTIYANFPYARGDRNLYHPDKNPNGIVSCANAENFLVHHDLIARLNSHAPFRPEHCTYHEGPSGSTRLRDAMAATVNRYFAPFKPVSRDQISFADGVTAVNENMALTICDPGESILLGRPAYGSFGNDLVQRTGVKLEFVDFGDIDQFSVDAVALYDQVLEHHAESSRIKIKALLICNPHNPLGSCYSREALTALGDLAVKHNIHLISDEIYALSVFRSLPDRHDASGFTSVLSLDLRAQNAEHLVHVLYGLSKDFGCAGLRLGCLITWNEELPKKIWPITRFNSVSAFSDDLASQLLEDTAFVDSYLAKSRSALAEAYQRASKQLDLAGIPYYSHGNAGFFIWMDLSKWLPLDEAGGDGWAAEKLLSTRFLEAGVIMGTAKAYHGAKPGGFRLVFSLEKPDLEEGFKRIKQVLGI